nr:MBL fold metallo-hydrolase [Thermosipho sp. 1244]
MNDKSKSGFYFEHGFSALVEFKGKKILFDTGQSDLFLKNVEKLGLNLLDLDTVVISHGHYDHGNGLEFLLKKVGPKKIYVGDGFFNLRYSGEKYAGIKHNRIFYEKIGGNFEIVQNDLEIFKGVKIITAAPLKTSEYSEKKFKIGSKKERDLFNDELYLFIESSNGAVILTGCSHRGIINIILHLSEKSRIKAVIGGFHLLNKTNEELLQISKMLSTFQIDALYPCHCTGDVAIDIFKKNLKTKVYECLAGSVFEF